MTELMIDQALFGYDDGHRLLQTSSRLSNYEKDLLLQLSDLAPGVSRLHEDGYWTGMPLRETSRYALLRTWPAPEMPRPGCVWSHALLIPFDFLHRPLHVTELLNYFQRPADSPKGIKRYSEPLKLDTLDFCETSRTPRAKELVSCIYLFKCNATGRLSQAELGLQALALWGQQWPALRCSFSFRTLERTGSGRSWLNNFDTMLTDGLLRLQREQTPLPDTGNKALEERLTEDLQGPLDSALRRFREEYGQDLPLHPIWTAFLCFVQLTLETTSERADHFAYKELLEVIGASLPELADGLHLKRSLMSFGKLSPLQLPLPFSIDALTFARTSDHAKSFPDLSLPDETVGWMWEHDRVKLLHLLSKTGKGLVDSRERILNQLLLLIPDDTLMEGTAANPSVRKDLVLLNPQLLRWKGLPRLPSSELIALLELFSESQIQEIDVIGPLISIRDTDFAQLLCARFPMEVVLAVCMDGSYLTHASDPHHVILRFAGDVADTYLTPDFVARLTTTTALLAFAAMLGFVNHKTIEAGPMLWAGALFSARVDSPQDQLQTLQAFALSLALANVENGSEALLEYSFEPLHEAMKESRLDYQASVIVEAILPEVKWWRRWDNCHRLRVAVIKAYAYGGLQPVTFFQLAKNENLLGAMFHELESKDKYHSFLDKLHRLNQNP